MGSLYIQFNTLQQIANAVRKRTNTNNLMSLSEIVNTIKNIDPDVILPRKGPNISQFTLNARYIMKEAFYNCSLLQSINLPNASYIGGNAFNNCRSLQSVNFPNANYIGNSAFYYCSKLQSVNLPNASYIGDGAFNNCRSLQSVNLPNASYIGVETFTNCRSLQSVSLPNVKYIAINAFSWCTSLQSVNLPMVSYIGGDAFAKCYNLLSLYLNSTSVCSLYRSTVFTSTPIAGYTTSTGGVYGSIYVPASLLTSYKTATNWTVFSSRFVGV